MPTADVRDRPDYSLGVDDAERARLLAQCALHRAEAEMLLDRIGLHAGDRVLDLGCGPLGVLDLFAERVGPAGRVVGLDREARYLAIARQELDARGFTGVELMVVGRDRHRPGPRHRSISSTSGSCSTTCRSRTRSSPRWCD